MKKYLARLTPEYLEKAEEGERGINRFSILTNPAIKVKGYFFESQEKFKTLDGMKMRIAAPAMLPESLYRKEEDGDPAHEIEFDEIGLTQLFDEFMRTFKQEDLINVDHSEEIAPAFIREIWQIENPETDRAFTEFGFKLPKGSIFIIIQFTDKAYFEEVVRTGRTGISVEAFFERKEYKFKAEKMAEKKKRYSFNAQTHGEDGKTESGESVIVVTDKEELTEGSEVIVIDEAMESTDDYSGDVVVDGKNVVITDGKIEQIDGGSETTEEEMETEEKKEDTTEEKMETEETNETTETTEEEMAEETTEAPTQISEEEIAKLVDEKVSASLEEVFKRIGEIEANMTSMDGDAEAKAQNFNDHSRPVNMFGWAKRRG